MKLTSTELTKLITLLQQRQVQAVLLHGPNYGLSCMIIEHLAKQMGYRVSSYHEKQLSVGEIFSLVNAASLFQEKEFIKIGNISPGIGSDMKKMLTNITEAAHKPENIIFFLAQDSLPPSGVRKFYEEHRNLVSIGCYYDNPETVARQIEKFFSKRGKVVSSEGLSYLKSHLKGDHLIIKSELEKLLYYVGAKSEVAIEDIRKVISHDLLASGDDMCMFFATKDYNNFLREVEKLRLENINEVLMLRALGRYFVNLYSVLSSVASGVSLDMAVKNLSPPIFFQYVGSFKRAAMKYNIQEVLSIIACIQRAEAMFKTSPGQFDILLSLDAGI